MERTGTAVLGALTIDTGGPPPILENAVLVITSQRTQPSLEVAVLIAGDLTVSGRVAVRGHRPLVILANSVQIDSSAGFDVEPADVPCPAGEGTPGASRMSAAAGGGGGGGFGAVGAEGGLGATQPPPAAAGGTEVGNVELVPLRGGCRGGQGGTPNQALTGASGGLGGGAIQISARQTMVIEGRVAAPGGGGKAASTSTAGAGGGGGGGGGAILLEASMIALGDEATVCANGGGGGAGTGSNEIASSGSDGQCMATPALGGIGATSGGNGGANIPAGAGASGDSDSSAGGGGGGGAVGRIRLNGPVSGTAWVVSPAPTRGPTPGLDS